MHTRRIIRPLAALALTLSLGLAGCGSGDDGSGDDTASAAATAGFPVTIKHAFGSATIDKAPTRVVAWGWGSADAAIALGVVPVAIPFQAYGGDDKGVLPWISEKLAATGASTPTVLPDAQEPPLEEIANARPDLILAVYSGITEDQYKQLSALAPTVAYPDQAWATPWRDLITTVGTALGRKAQADALLAGIDNTLAEQAKAHPELAGKSVAMVWDDGDKFYVYKEADPRVQFALDLGMTGAQSVRDLATDESTFYYTISKEKVDQLTSDVLVAFATTQQQLDAFLGSAYGKTMPQVRDGHVASLVGEEFIASVSPPTALSLTWGIDRYVAALSKAVSG